MYIYIFFCVHSAAGSHGPEVLVTLGGRSGQFISSKRKTQGTNLMGRRAHRLSPKGRLIVSAAAIAGSMQPSTAISQLQMPNANYNNYAEPFYATLRSPTSYHPIIISIVGRLAGDVPRQTCINQSGPQNVKCK